MNLSGGLRTLCGLIGSRSGELFEGDSSSVVFGDLMVGSTSDTICEGELAFEVEGELGSEMLSSNGRNMHGVSKFR